MSRNLARLSCAGAIVAALACAAGGWAQGIGGPPSLPAKTAAGTAITDAFRGVMQDRGSKTPAEALYVEKCGMCHRQMGMGTVILSRRVDPAVAWLEKRDDLTEQYVIEAARTGIGNMPRIQRGEVSDSQLKTIATYLAKGKK